MRLNVLCWPEGVKLHPSSWIPSPQPRTRSAFGRVPQISVAFSCERAGTQWKPLTRLLEDLCAHSDICLSSGFGIWSFKLTCLPMQLCQAVAPDFPVIPASEVWLQGDFDFTPWAPTSSDKTYQEHFFCLGWWVQVAQTTKHHLWHKPEHLAFSSGKKSLQGK